MRTPVHRPRGRGRYDGPGMTDQRNTARRRHGGNARSETGSCLATAAAFACLASGCTAPAVPERAAADEPAIELRDARWRVSIDTGPHVVQFGASSTDAPVRFVVSSGGRTIDVVSAPPWGPGALAGRHGRIRLVVDPERLSEVVLTGSRNTARIARDAADRVRVVDRGADNAVEPQSEQARRSGIGTDGDFHPRDGAWM